MEFLIIHFEQMYNFMILEFVKLYDFSRKCFL
jgi:hypothetical protein